MVPNDPDEAAVMAGSYWEELREDVVATLEEYQEAGYEATLFHPGVTTVLASEYGDDLPGLAVLLPQGEVEEVESLIDPGGFDGAEIYASRVGSLVLLGLFFSIEEPARVIGFQSYYLPNEAEGMLEEAREAGHLSVLLHSQYDDEVLIECADPDLFVPEALR
ncbi:DUF7529 family protein [Natronorarus salvus]|uniref:DUF7529 family protein n=1 Tax=Natronorarus salvus TaxID=3117733 RepID=UPI002F264DE5